MTTDASGLGALSEDLWIADGPIVRSLGFAYPTRMAVIRLADGSLFVWSPVAMTDALRDAVDALGEVRHIVPPNAFHHLALAEWKAAYPAAVLYAAPRLAARRADLSFDRNLAGDEPRAWDGEIDQVVIGGNTLLEEVVFHHRASRTVLFCDLLQQFPEGWFGGWRALVARLDGMVGKEPTVPRKFRLAFRDRAAARQDVKSVLAWSGERLIVAHGDVVEADATAVIERAFRRLLRERAVEAQDRA